MVDLELGVMPGGGQLMITGSYLLDSWRLRSGACGLKEIHVPYPGKFLIICMGFFVHPCQLQ